jgi:isoleucyl-tRNA synthetase
MRIEFPKLEEKILKFWRKNKIFEKSIENRKNKKDFVFYEGPPTANAPPGLHHVLSRVFKDIICRYRTMKGFRVERKAGWDTHGLPVELQIEKKLGFKNKGDIEKFGVAKFNKECKKSVWEYKKVWERLTERIGFWLDLKNPYITYDPEYIETLWFILKKIWEKGLLYQDFKVVAFCPRCQTPLSSHEVAQGYKKIKEPAIYVKFKVKNPKIYNLEPNTSLLIWTTTPWTLPGNVAVAVNPEFDYLELKINNEFLILAKERKKALDFEGEIIKEMKGKELIGLKYESLFDFYKPKKEDRIWEVLEADFVTLEEGTGLVHIAPAFGEEDMELVKSQNARTKNQKFPIILNVDEEGKFKEEVEKFKGLFVKEADPLIIEDLKERGLLLKEEIYEHDYPFCWRCKTPLLYYAKKSWFIRVTKVKKDLIKNNRKINWIPSHIKKGRFGEWLKEVKDWALSRERYWGTPLPIWQCKKCKKIEVIGSIKELLSKKFSKNRYFLLRHGESELQVKFKDRIQIWEKSPKEYPLTEKGKEQIKKLIKKLEKEKIDLIFSSDFLRTKQTAQIIAKALSIKIIFDKRLRDINYGDFCGRLKREYFEKFPDTLEKFEKNSKKPKKGENWFDVKKRMLNFIEDVERKYQGRNILIVSHGDPLWILEGILKGKKNEDILRERIKKGVIKIGELRKIEYKRIPLNNENLEIDLHRPYIDKVKFYCKECNSLMERVPEVIDCWFDSGAMPFAQCHWPFSQNQKPKTKNQKLKPPKLFPANYIAEGIDQTRGWFYTLLAISTLLGFGPSYKNVISLGHVLDEKGEKMSKSKGNVVDPWLIIEKYGADTARWYFFTINQPWDSKLFSEKDVKEILKKFILTLWNCYQFFETYVPKDLRKSISKTPIPKNLLDKWILSKLNKLVLEVIERLEKFDVTFAARTIENFVINDLSLWYIRRSRKRFQKPERRSELKEASHVLGFVLLTLSKLIAPFVPFLSEEIYQRIQNLNYKTQRSVHLENWPKSDKELIDKSLERRMEKAREIVKLALAERAKVRIKIRQPLKKLTIKESSLKRFPELLELIKEEVNVKKVSFGKSFKLDTKITPELKEEGILREIVRQIQQKRKEEGLKPRQKIIVFFEGEREIISVLEKYKERILKVGKIKKVIFREPQKFDFEIKIKVDQKSISAFIKK